MKRILIACSTIRDELEKAMRDTGFASPVVWVESGLHLVPESLRRRIQEELDRIPDVEHVLLGFGFCGNAILGLETRAFELVLPRVDDCITWLLGSGEKRMRCTEAGGVYFLTRGWLQGEANIWREYQGTIDRYGPERAQTIYRQILRHYRFLGLIDTGAFDVGEMIGHINEIAAVLKLEPRIFTGSDAYLKEFLVGPWRKERFLIVPPRTRIELFHVLSGTSSRGGPHPPGSLSSTPP